MNITKQKFGSGLGFLFIIISTFTLDIMTKMLAQKNFLLSSGLVSIRDYNSTNMPVFILGGNENWFELSLTYVRNTGAAWGFLSNMNETIRPYFFNTLTVIAIILIITFFIQTPRRNTLARLGLCFVFAGACGNFWDRFAFHYVVDWIHVRWEIFSWYYDFPVFNIADSCVTLGVSLLVINSICTNHRRKKHGTAAVSQKLNK